MLGLSATVTFTKLENKMFGKRKKQAQAIQTVVRTVQVRTDEDKTLRANVSQYVENAENEYARLAKSVSDALDARDEGRYYDRGQMDRDQGKMHVLVASVAAVTGTDLIVMSFKMDKLAQARRNGRFPLNSFLSNGSLIYAN
jgi:hypothetical protein